MLVLVCIGVISIFFNGDKRSVRSLLEEELNEKSSFLGGLAAAVRNQVHTDIEAKPGHNGPSLFVHRALLPARSEIFKNMLDSEGCKAAPSNTIKLPELNHEGLDSLLKFLYSGASTAGQAYEANHLLLHGNLLAFRWVGENWSEEESILVRAAE